MKSRAPGPEVSGRCHSPLSIGEGVRGEVLRQTTKGKGRKHPGVFPLGPPVRGWTLGQKLLRINTMPDHLHALIGLRPSMAPSDLIRDVKSDSSRWINERGLCRHPFSWQDGYGAFSVCKRHVDVVAAYIENQKEHHRREGFLEEVKRILKEEGLAFDDRYLFYAPV